MSEETTAETAEESSSDETKTEASSDKDTAAAAEAAAPPEKKKKRPRRKSVWVCIPMEWDEIAQQDPETGDLKAVRQPVSYSVTECPGGEGQKKAVLAVLSRHHVDPTNFEGVLMFRADPIPFQIDQQLILRGPGL
jgi:hypothetical protein